jgi:hypothetical protein
MLATPASAQELGKALFEALGLAQDEEKPSIDYRERAPLVVPPNLTLRTPQSGDLNEARPNWPQDPDAARRRAIEADRNTPRFLQSDRERSRPLTPDEIRAGRRQQAQRPFEVPAGQTRDGSREEWFVSPDKLRNLDLPAQQALLPGQEPKREFLTDPPPGYRIPAGNKALQATRDQAAPRADERPEYDLFRRQ